MRREGIRMRYAVLGMALIGLMPFAARAQQVAPPPLDIVLENRQTLLLTARQIARLDSLRTDLKARNEPLIADVLELRAQFQREQRAANRAAGRQQGAALRTTPGQVQAQPQVARLEQIRVTTQSLVQQIQANNRAAMQQANQMLTAPQRRRLRDLVEARRPSEGPMGAPGRAGQPRPPANLGG
jgi:chromosome segregation ATPase